MVITYTGPMFSNKSRFLIEKYEKITNKECILAFKPKIDDRDYGIIKSRTSPKEIKATCINNLSEIKKYVKKDTKIIFIDEAQFLKGSVMELVYLSINNNIDFYIAGVNQTSELKPFGIMPDILSISQKIHICKSLCFNCHKKANYTYYKYNKNKDNVIGDDGYMPICTSCLRKILKNKKE